MTPRNHVQHQIKSNKIASTLVRGADVYVEFKPSIKILSKNYQLQPIEIVIKDKYHQEGQYRITN
jgi:hypothetical protein